MSCKLNTVWSHMSFFFSLGGKSTWVGKSYLECRLKEIHVGTNLLYQVANWTRQKKVCKSWKSVTLWGFSFVKKYDGLLLKGKSSFSFYIKYFHLTLHKFDHNSSNKDKLVINLSMGE